MTADLCATHPQAEALFRCDGCGRLLCQDCVEHGHRLFICRQCRERALPLDAALPADVPGRRRALARRRGYGWGEVLQYPLRGQGGGVFWSYLVLVALLRLFGALPGIGRLTLVFWFFIAILTPGMLYAIVRRTAAGDDQLPEWPDAGELGERWREVFTSLCLGAAALVPGMVLMWVSGCAEALLDDELPGGLCLALLAAGLGVGLALAVPAFGALAIYESGWLLVRPDLHARALFAAGTDGLRTVAFVYVFLAAGRLAAWFLHPVPWLGGLLGGAASAYGSFVAAHLVGWMFLRHEPALNAIYLA
jgi:hypothetical protein